jgi:hypothetical protein
MSEYLECLRIVPVALRKNVLRKAFLVSLVPDNKKSTITTAAGRESVFHLLDTLA